MLITFNQAKKYQPLEKVIVQSIEQTLYQVFIVIDGHENLLCDNDKKPFKFRNILSIVKQLAPLSIVSMTLRHQSAYDEMIGQSYRLKDNTLEVPLLSESFKGLH